MWSFRVLVFTCLFSSIFCGRLKEVFQPVRRLSQLAVSPITKGSPQSSNNLDKSSSNSLVQVEQGWLQGKEVELVTKDGTYQSFKGIPYAKPPVADLRFKAPKPPVSWEGIRNATEHGSRCPHRDLFTSELVLGNENCLFLNVYTPNLAPEKHFPVIFYIHGGGYKSGSGNSDFLGPDFLVQHDVVLVTINFRLGVFGLLSMDTAEVSGNAAMKDQVAALRWMQKNIAAFGGDPNNVTIMGQSAGGASVGYHMFSPMSKGLFNRAILLSGTPLNDWNAAYEPRRRAFDVAKDLGYYATSTDDLLKYLQSVEAEKLIDFAPNVLGVEVISNYFIKYFQFTPVVEKDYGQERFLVESPLESLLNLNVHDVDVFMGYTKEEATTAASAIPQWLAQFDYYPELLAPRTLSLNCKPDIVLQASDRIRSYYFGNQRISINTITEFISYVSDIAFVSGNNRFADLFPDICGRSFYFYTFSCFTERNIYGQSAVTYGIEAAGHLDDLMYLFNAESVNLEIKKGTTSYDLVQKVTTIFTNFAKYGNPTPDSSLGITWPEYSPVSKQYVDINEELTLRSNPNADESRFWNEIFGLLKTC